MARARNIKPGFFTNDALAEASPLARILFAGLWCFADREGRLHDRPKKIKAEILPYDDCNADDLLESLAVLGFILRYEVAGIRYIQVLNFDKHQNPHVKEQASEIPAPDLHQTSTGQEQGKNEESPEVAGLIPSSLIPDSGLPSKTTRAPRFDAQAHLSELGIPADLASDWIEHRKARKAKVTKTAIDGIAGEALKAGLTLDAVLRECCARGWIGFKADWMQRDGGNARAGPGYQSIHDKRAETIANLTGRSRNERTSNAERDITGESTRVA